MKCASSAKNFNVLDNRTAGFIEGVDNLLIAIILAIEIRIYPIVLDKKFFTILYS